MKYIILQYPTLYFLGLLHLFIPSPGRHFNHHIIVSASPLPYHWFNVRSVRRVHHGDTRLSLYFFQIIILIDFQLFPTFSHISFSNECSQFNLSLFFHAVHQHRTALFRCSYPCTLKPTSIHLIYPTVRPHHDRLSARLYPTGISPRQVLQRIYITSQLVLSLSSSLCSTIFASPRP